MTTPSGEKKWVLIVSLNPGGYAGGSGTQYFIGDWNGTTFTTDQSQTKWIDYGRDNYAGVTFSNAPDNRRIFIGWMSNWDYAAKLPSPIWRTSMTAPRELALVNVGNELLLTSHPIEELTSENDYIFTLTKDENATILIGDDENKVVISYDATISQISIDRSSAWFDGIDDVVQKTPTITAEEFTIRLLVDHGSCELFIPETGLAVTFIHNLPAQAATLQKTAKQLQ